MNKRGIIYILFIIIFLVSKPAFLIAQTEPFQVIKGLPTNEIYDLMVDSKGLLWIAHDLGLSTYDGKTMRHYFCKEQKAKAITGLVEDKYGRVWCHNFVSQVFWIKDDVMHLLKEYDAKKEPSFPTIIICGDNLVVSSSGGFFSFDLKTSTPKLISTAEAVSKLAPGKNKVVTLADQHGNWMSYNAGTVKMLKHKADMPNANESRAMALQNIFNNDTIFALESPADKYCRYKISSDSVVFIDESKMNSFINCITQDGAQIWVHTKTGSYLIGTNEKISNLNLTDIVTDKEGNRWLSSLKYGLMMQPSSKPGRIDINVRLNPGDYFCNMVVAGIKCIWGTQEGDVFIQDSLDAPGLLVASLKGRGAIENLYVYDSTHIIVCPAIGVFVLDLKTGSISEPYKIGNNNIKGISSANNCLAFSTNIGLMLTPKLFSRQPVADWLNSLPYKPVFSWSDFFRTWKYQRCRASAFSAFNNALLASFKDGLVEIKDNNGGAPLTYNGRPIDGRTLLAYKDKVFIATVFDDILVYDRNGLHRIAGDALQQSKDILLVKLLGTQLWIVSNYGIKIIDADTEKPIGYYELPGVNFASIMNIDYINGKVIFITESGVYSLEAFEKNRLHYPEIKLLYATANNTINIQAGKQLPHEQSDIRFYVSVPWYSGADAVTIAYRLIGDKDTSWQYTSRSDQPIHYSSLAPGEYVFETKAIHRLSGFNSKVERLPFIIKKPWWQLTWFWILVCLLSIGIIVLLVTRYYSIRLQKQKHFYEKELAVEKERQRISADIHDELGGTLSGIKLMTEMVERKYDDQSNVKKELNDIHLSVTGLTQKMREVIWSLSNENNALDNLLDYLLRRGKEMFVNSNIQFHAELPQVIPSVQLNGDKRRHIYLAVKEALNNVLKHSNATDVHLSFAFKGRNLIITIRDDGQGFETNDSTYGNGLKNMRARMEQLDGDMQVQKENGVTLIFSIPLN